MLDVISKSFSRASLLPGATEGSAGISFSASFFPGTSECTPCQRRVNLDSSLSQNHSGKLSPARFPDPFMVSAVPEGDDEQSAFSDLCRGLSTRCGITPYIHAVVWLSLRSSA